MIELEKTYLAKRIPENLKDCIRKEIIDVYIPKSAEHPKLRLRKNGYEYELTKKESISDVDASRQEEQTITLSEAEFNALNDQIEGKRINKTRYYYGYNGRTAEFDIFQGKLRGLILIDFEFKDTNEKDNFMMPDFCLADVTQKLFIAGGMICGKSYKDIEGNLKKFRYKKLLFG